MPFWVAFAAAVHSPSPQRVLTHLLAALFARVNSHCPNSATSAIKHIQPLVDWASSFLPSVQAFVYKSRFFLHPLCFSDTATAASSTGRVHHGFSPDRARSFWHRSCGRQSMWCIQTLGIRTLADLIQLPCHFSGCIQPCYQLPRWNIASSLMVTYIFTNPVAGIVRPD